MIKVESNNLHLVKEKDILVSNYSFFDSEKIEIQAFEFSGLIDERGFYEYKLIYDSYCNIDYDSKYFFNLLYAIENYTVLAMNKEEFQLSLVLINLGILDVELIYAPFK